MIMITLDHIKSCRFITADSEEYHCTDLFIDDRDWTVNYLVLEKHPWNPLGEKLAVSPAVVSVIDQERKLAQLRVDEDELKRLGSQNLQLAPVSEQKKSAIFRTYGYGQYWMGKGLEGTYPQSNELLNDTETKNNTIRPTENSAPEDGSEENSEHNQQASHLRSMEELVGYEVIQRDKRFGRAKNFLCNSDVWEISHCLTQSGVLHHRRWAIPTEHIHNVSWSAHALRLD